MPLASTQSQGFVSKLLAPHPHPLQSQGFVSPGGGSGILMEGYQKTPKKI